MRCLFIVLINNVCYCNQHAPKSSRRSLLRLPRKHVGSAMASTTGSSPFHSRSLLLPLVALLFACGLLFASANAQRPVSANTIRRDGSGAAQRGDDAQAAPLRSEKVSVAPAAPPKAFRADDSSQTHPHSPRTAHQSAASFSTFSQWPLCVDVINDERTNGVLGGGRRVDADRSDTSSSSSSSSSTSTPSMTSPALLFPELLTVYGDTVTEDGVVRGLTQSLQVHCALTRGTDATEAAAPANRSPSSHLPSRAQQQRTRARRRLSLPPAYRFLGDAFTILLGLPEEELQAPLHSTLPLYFMNLTASDVRSAVDVHGAASEESTAASTLVQLYRSVGEAKGGGERAPAPQSEEAASRSATGGTADAATAAASAGAAFDDWSDHFSSPLEAASSSSPFSLASSNKLGRWWQGQLRVGQAQLNRLRYALRQYPWLSLSALERLFCVRVLRVHLPVDVGTKKIVLWTPVERSKLRPKLQVFQTNDDEESLTEIDVDGEGRKELERELDWATTPPRLRSRALQMSEGALSRLRVVVYPPTPLLVPAATTANAREHHEVDETKNADTMEEASSLSSTSPSITRFTCSFATVLEARERIVEAELKMAAAAAASASASAGDESSLFTSLLRGSTTESRVKDAQAGGGDYGSVVGSGRRDRSSTVPQSSSPFPFSPTSLLTSWLTQRSGASSSTAAHTVNARPSPVKRSSMEAEQQNGQRHRATLSATALHRMMLNAARDYDGLVSEELGPYQRPSVLMLPSWISQLLGRRTLATQHSLRTETSAVESDDGEEEEDGSVSGGREGEAHAGYTLRSRTVRTTAWYVFEATLPATQTMCVALSGIPQRSPVTRARADSTSATDGLFLPVHVEQFLTFDTLWLKLLVTAYTVHVIRPYVEGSRLAHYILSGLFGVFILFMMVLLYVVREVQRMTIGKVGVLVVLAVGGVTAFAEGVLSALGQLLYTVQEQQTDLLLYVSIGLLILAQVSSIVMQLLFPRAYLEAGTRWGLRVVVCVVFLLSFARNREATVLTCVMYVLFHPRRLVRVVRWASGASAFENHSNEPADTFPASSRKTLRYAAPLVEEAGAYGGYAAEDNSSSGNHRSTSPSRALSHAAKMKKFEEDGAVYTQRALQQLAAQIRADPARYATRLRDPNGVVRWAGAHDTQQPASDGDDYYDSNATSGGSTPSRSSTT